jgi:hypothetical protein
MVFSLHFLLFKEEKVGFERKQDLPFPKVFLKVFLFHFAFSLSKIGKIHAIP